MGTINFGDDDPWVVAGWAFGGFLHHVHDELKDQRDLLSIVEQAIALDGLHLARKEPDVARRLAPVLLAVADDIVAGTRPVSVEGRGVLDEESQIMFRRAVKDLRERILRYLSREPPSSEGPKGT